MRKDAKVTPAMMADAGNEAFILIRHLDTDEVATGELVTHIQTFMDRIVFLFLGEGVFRVSGHTQTMLKSLEATHTFQFNGVARSG